MAVFVVKYVHSMFETHGIEQTPSLLERYVVYTEYCSAHYNYV